MRTNPEAQIDRWRRDFETATADHREGAPPDAAWSVESRLYAALRRDSHAGLSNRALQREYGVSWSTVNKVLSSAWPQPRAPRRSKLDPFKAVIDKILLLDLDARRSSGIPRPGSFTG